jgi:endonuclease-3
MARKSPRSRKKAKDAPKVPSARRAIAAPGRRRAKTKRATRAAHAPKGARSASKSTRGAPRGPQRGLRRTVRRAKTAKRSPASPGAAPRAAARFAPPAPDRVAAILGVLEREFPDATTALDVGTPLQLLIATILSAQCTDERVNMTTPGLFAKYPDAAALAAAPQEEVEEIVRSTGFFRMKAKAIREASADIVAKHGGEVPRTMDELTALRGVGRKTANVVLGNAYGVPGLVVDTHVARLSNRLGLTNEKDPVKIELALMPVIPESRWTAFSHWLILHGRRTCNARKPFCSRCALVPHCPRTGVKVSQ